MGNSFLRFVLVFFLFLKITAFAEGSSYDQKKIHQLLSLYHKAHYQKVLKKLNKCLEQDSGHFPLTYQLLKIDVNERLGYFEKNDQLIVTLAKKEKKESQDNFSRTALKAAEIYVFRKDFLSASHWISKINPADPCDSVGQQIRKIKIQLFNHEGFFDSAHYLLKNEPCHSAINSDYFLWLQYYYEKGDYQELEYYFSSIKLSSIQSLPPLERVKILTIYGQTLFKLAKYSQALEVFKQALKIGKKNFPNYHPVVIEIKEHLVKTYLKNDKLRKAQRLIKQIYRNSLKFGNDHQHIYYFPYLRLSAIRWVYRKKIDLAYNRIEQLLQLQEKVLPQYHPLKISNLEFIYDLYIQTNEYEKADSINNEILRQSSHFIGNNSPKFALQKLKWASHTLSLDYEIKKSENILNGEEWNTYINKYSTSHYDYLPLQNARILLFELKDDFKQALETANKALAISRHNSKQAVMAKQLATTAEINMMLANFDTAGYQLKKAIDIFEKNSVFSQEYIKAVELIAEYYTHVGNGALAMTYINKTQDLISKYFRRTKVEIQANYELLAEIYLGTGRYKEAEKVLIKSLAFKKKSLPDNHYLLIKTYMLLGKVNLLKGDLAKAEDFTQKANDISKSTNQEKSLNYITSLEQLGTIYFELGDYPQALKIFENTEQYLLNIFGKDHIKLAQVYKNEALSYYFLDRNISKAEELVEHAMMIVKNNFGENHPSYNELLELLAAFEIKLHNYPQAETLLNQAETNWATSNNKSALATARIKMVWGDLKMLQKDFKEAKELYEAGSKIYRKTFDKNHPEYIESLSKQALALYKMGDVDKSLEMFASANDKYITQVNDVFPFLSEREKIRFWKKLDHSFKDYFSIALNEYPKNPEIIKQVLNFRLKTKSLILSSLNNITNFTASTNDTSVINKIESWRKKKEEYIYKLSLSGSAEDESAEALGKEINSLEKEISKSYAEFSQIINPNITWKNVSENLNDSEVAIEVIKSHLPSNNDSVIYAFILVTKRGDPKLVVLHNGQNLENRLFRFYQNSLELRLVDSRSYYYFWKKIDEKIPDHYTVLVSPDGIYNKLNPETFLDNNNKYVIEKNPVVFVSNLSDINLKKNKEVGNHTAVLFGNPDFGESSKKITNSSSLTFNIKPLPGTEKEVQEIDTFLTDSHWKTKLFLGKAASEENIKKIQGPQLLHIATHGYFYDTDTSGNSELSIFDEREPLVNPLTKSGLVFAGASDLVDDPGLYLNKKSGILTAYETSTLKLSGTQLVVLSACESGLGEVSEGEGVYGLQRSFLVAGASSVITSLFKVNDEVTSQLMVKFYDNWVSGMEIKSAFRKAKLEIKNKYPAPVFWGSFIMMSLN